MLSLSERFLSDPLQVFCNDPLQMSSYENGFWSRCVKKHLRNFTKRLTESIKYCNFFCQFLPFSTRLEIDQTKIKNFVFSRFLCYRFAFTQYLVLLRSVERGGVNPSKYFAIMKTDLAKLKLCDLPRFIATS